ncbi:hypothetical protein FRB97_006533 [Tulasnella sp. 331]|nr:hypothetical protein FRB97_006533 [Tulasnella sp. 331]
MWSRLSTILTSHQLQTPNASGDYTFYMKTYSENETFLQQMTEQGILGKVVGTPEVKQGFVSFPLVETKISLKEMSKQMKMLSLKQLLLALIVLLPLDIKAVTVSTALAIPTTNSQARGLTMTIMSMASADNSAANEDRTTSTTAPKQKEGRAPHSFLQSIRDDVVMLESLSKDITPTSGYASDTTTPQVNSPSTASSSPSSGINTASVLAIMAVLTAITVYVTTACQGGQGIWLPWREHREKMKALAARRRAAEAVQRSAEEGLLRHWQSEVQPDGTNSGVGVSLSHFGLGWD